MTEKNRDSDDLNAFFEASRAQTPVPSAALIRRVGRDGARVRRRAMARLFADRMRQVAAALGGWGGLSGLAAASATGIWLGYAPPAGWPDPVSMLARGNADLTLIESDELAFMLGGGGG